MSDHCGCRQGSVRELMDQHEVIAAMGDEIRRHLATGDEPAARERLDAMLAILRPHVQWEEAGLFAQMSAQVDLDEHIYRENFGVFPGAIAVLEAEDWDAIEALRPALSAT